LTMIVTVLMICLLRAPYEKIKKGLEFM